MPEKIQLQPSWLKWVASDLKEFAASGLRWVRKPECVSRPSDLRAAGTVTRRQRGQAAWAGRGCEAANPSSDLRRTSVDVLLDCPSVEAGPPPGRQDAPRDEARQRGNSRCVEEEPGLLGKDALTQPSKGLCLGPQNLPHPSGRS